jgi:hypothetical protein
MIIWSPDCRYVGEVSVFASKQFRGKFYNRAVGVVNPKSFKSSRISCINYHCVGVPYTVAHRFE